MTDFLSSTACHGQKPRRVGTHRHYSRSDLLAKMILQRHVARFLIAPSYFGKTALALEYAEAIFSFQNVFWINCQSPCFLRDLDAEIIVSGLTAKGAAAALVVFEDIPHLDAPRADALSAAIDCFLEMGWEVVATATPSCDAFADRQADRVKVSSREFLLSYAEVEEAQRDFEGFHEPPANYSATERIPGIFWRQEGFQAAFLESIVKEELPSEMLLPIFIMLVLKSGRLADMDGLVKHWKPDIQTVLGEDYLYLGIDMYRERYCSYSFTMPVLAEAFAGRMDLLVGQSRFAAKNTLISRLADLLMARGEHERACSLMSLLCSVPHRRRWLDEKSFELFKAGCFLGAHEVCASFSVPADALGMSILSAELWRLSYLGDKDQAQKIASRISNNSQATEEAKASAALWLVRNANVEALRQKAQDFLTLLSGQNGIADADPSSDARIIARGGKSPGVFLGCATLLLEDAGRSLGLLRKCFGSGEGRAVYSILAAWVAERASNLIDKDGLTETAQHEAEALVHEISAYIGRCAQKRQLCFPDALLHQAVEKLCRNIGIDLPFTYPEAAKAYSSAAIMDLVAQKTRFERINRDAFMRKDEQQRTRPGEYRSNASNPRITAVELDPMLYVRLFGGVEVYIGDKMVDQKLLARKRLKNLLALLVVNQGREFSRNRLVEVLWSDRDPRDSRQQLYHLWSLLGKALTTPAGRCPYLVRHQHSYKIDARYVSSDAAKLDALCRRLLFEDPSIREWSQIYKEIDDLYAGDFMPGETENAVILKMREDYRNRLVDSLVSAAKRLHNAGEVQVSIWFARLALERDPLREDAYTLLMEAQVELGQRTAALGTYFSCMRMLSDKLGIDPSLKTINLYNEIIEENPSLRGFAASIPQGF